MSLRRRIAAAAALAVAAVAVALGGIAYATTRSHLIGEVQQELEHRASGFLEPGDHDHGGGFPGAPPGATGSEQHAPPAQPFGGAPGYFEVVRPDGTATAINGTLKLPVGSDVLAVARTGRGRFFRDATVSGHHLEILTVGQGPGQGAVEVALPLSSVDDVLSGVLLTYGILMGAGVLIAGLLGLLIARTALAPIDRFTEQTEAVASALDRPRRLEVGQSEELRRLAASFNQTLDALERSIQAQRHLIADASHELRTPLSSLRSNIQIFLDSDRLPEEDRRDLQDSIVAELDELTQLVSDVLELARGSDPGAHAEPVELDQIVREAVARARRRAPQMTFRVELEPTVIVHSPDRVSRAVSNVIDNARKWSPEDGVVEVSLQDGVLSVRDHGSGFRQEDLELVFDRFYRSQAARRMPGSGLGLAIVKQTAEAHGGFARAANAEGGGAVITVSFGPSIRSRRAAADAVTQLS